MSWVYSEELGTIGEIEHILSWYGVRPVPLFHRTSVGRWQPTDEVIEWCNRTCGAGNWSFTTEFCHTMVFDTKRHAMMFKLVFEGA